MKRKFELIVISSNEPWGDVWYSKQHFAYQLSKEFKVIFVNPPAFWTIKNIFEFKVNSTKVNENLTVIDYKNNFPQRVIPLLFIFFNDFLNYLKIIHFCNRKRILFWFFDPFRFAFFPQPKNCKFIYHVVDPFSHLKTDRILAQKANLVVCVSEKYIENYQKYNRNVIYIPHGIREEEYQLEIKELQEVQELYRDCILFVGTLNSDVDISLLKKIALTFNDEKLVLVGPSFLTTPNEVNLLKEVINLPNVNAVGEVHAGKIKYFVATSKLCIVPYKRKLEQNIHRTPLKILNYLAQKKSVVTTINYELTGLENNAIYSSENESNFLELIRLGLNEELFVNDLLVEKYLSEVNYKKLIEIILSNLEGFEN